MKTFTATELLAITKPEQLFTNESSIKDEYRSLSMKWHPDKNPKADTNVFPHISSLYKLAEQKVEADAWGVSGAIKVTTVDGQDYRIRYHTHRSFELGEIYVCNTIIAYLIHKDYADLVKNATDVVSNLKYANDKMRNDFSPLMPKAKITQETDTHYLVIYDKPNDVFCARDILNQQNNKIPAVHAAWMMSRAYNLACFLNYNGIAHTAISVDNLYVCPKLHTACLLGGWWYATKVDKPLKSMSAFTYNMVPHTIFKDKIANTTIDLELIKIFGREILGDMHGTKLISDPTIPKPLLNWLKTPCGNSPIEEYSTWRNRILIDSFGKRTFVEFPITKEQIYQ